jgi:GNAT superfamily N-acetyltransferase
VHEVEIRWAAPDEYEALLDVMWRASMVWDDDRPHLLAHPEVVTFPFEQIERQRVRVAVIDDVVVGFSAVIPNDDGTLELDGLFVEPDLMRRGVGRLLIDDAVARARRDGMQRLCVIANLNALGFYKKLGFVAAGAAPTDFGPALRMHLDPIP